jgi:anti-sigma regulatory factor (Ser/Thr protein kinase)
VPDRRFLSPLARHRVIHHLRGTGTPGPPLSDVALAVSEAVTNAVVHADVDRPAGEVRIGLVVETDEVVFTVEDDRRGLVPRPDSPGLGLGLPLMATVASRVETRVTPAGGTRVCVWFGLDSEAAALEP